MDNIFSAKNIINGLLLAKKYSQSPEVSFLRKNLRKKPLMRAFNTIKKTDYKKLASNPKTYRTLGKSVDYLQKLNSTLSNDLGTISGDAKFMYDDKFGNKADYVLGRTSKIAKATGNTLERVKKPNQSNLQKGIIIGNSALNTALDLRKQ